MKELYMIKIGGGSITDVDKPMTAKRGEIARLLSEIQRAQRAVGFDVIVGHGSGSFAHVTAAEHMTQDGIVNAGSQIGAAMTKAVANQLNSIVVDEALKLGMPAFPFSPASFAVADGKRLDTGFVTQIGIALKAGFIPIVHGDVVMDTKQGVAIVSTEEVMRFIALRMPVKKIVFATDVDGAYDSDPRKNPNAKLVERVDPSNIDSVLAGAGGSHKTDVTGGMRPKIELLYGIVEKSPGSTGYIANATKPGVLQGVLLGEKITCTAISASRSGSLSRMK